MSQNDSKLCEEIELCEKFGLKRIEDGDLREVFEAACQLSFAIGVAAVYADEFERHEAEQVSLMEFVDRHWYPHNNAPMTLGVISGIEEADRVLKEKLGRGY